MKNNNSFLDRILQNRILSHLLFWCSFLVIFTILGVLDSGTFKPNALTNLAMLPSQIAAAYFLNYYQLPKLLLKKRYFLFFVSIFLSVYFLSAFARFNVVHIVEPFFRENFEQETIKEILLDFIYIFSVYCPAVYTYALIMLAVKAIKTRFEEKHQIELLQKEKATSELKFLKAQIQPHFLFNTLNNLYALTLAKSDLAPKVVLKLSELLDFILYQSDQAFISIEKEIELIQGFIDLESLRYGNALDVSFEKRVDDLNTQIAPLVLLPLIENAFKHGVSSDPKNAKIHIDLLVESATIKFKVFNTKLNDSVKQVTNTKSGIGTSNLKRQLEINYPNKYTLEIDEKRDSYFVELLIDLS
ncbi:Histidine kinase [Aquimarina amphilecti]|uniref:Histidine kinase n=1 Tax=Aquimarina amphilecti TaxID=1038014 RepID=A0A1H7KEN6_AQUAM|nr:histidine kinase [Aquimarina amphilecti]SEK85269.1 Histidine kinase [Aquimarina amphilecti]